jgi:hypothetical protein
MSRYILFILTIIVLTSSDCKQEGRDCHYVVRIQNESAGTVRWGTLESGTGGCRLSGHLLQSGAHFDYRPYNWCIENSGMANGDLLDIYFIDSALYNPENVYYSCDSIAVRNKILRHDVLNLADLRELEFRVGYR